MISYYIESGRQGESKYWRKYASDREMRKSLRMWGRVKVWRENPDRTLTLVIDHKQKAGWV